LYRWYISGVVFAAALSFVAAAQDPPAGDPATGGAAKSKPAANNPGIKGKPGAAKGAPAGAPAPAADKNVLPPPKGGDKIYMKGGPGGGAGSVLTGVQVLRSTPLNYEVQIIEGEPPLLIPRNQVERVEFDDIDPVRDRLREQLFPKAQEVTIASGERVTGALRDKLEGPISAEPLSYKDQDFIHVLDEVKTKTGVNLNIDSSIEEKQAAQRRWTVDIPADKKLMTLLREDLVGAFNFVEVEFESDSILVMTKEAGKKRAAAAAAAAAAGTPAAKPSAGVAPNAATPGKS
jgi:hypothetical protein